MRCPKCGSEVNNDMVFCPVCDNPLKVTADYDYIQAQIGGKVDQLLNADKNPDSVNLDDGVDIKDGKMDVESTVSNTVTRDIFQRDSVFDEHGNTIDQPFDFYGVNPEPYEDEDYDDDEYYDDYDDEEQEITGGGGNGSKTGLIIGILAAVVVIVALALCFVLGVFNKKEEPIETQTDAVDVITSNLEEGGEYSLPLKIILQSELGNRMYYTLDGSDPSVSSDMYTGSLVLNESTITGDKQTIELKVVSYTNNSMKSGDYSVKFTIVRSEIEMPYISPSSGNYDTISEITISARKGATIYYTYDGTTPTRDSEVYTGPIKMKRGNYILSAIAVLGDMESGVASSVFNVELKPVFNYNQAESIVIRHLIDKGLVMDENGVLEDGTSRHLFSVTSFMTDTENYYVIEVDHFDTDGTVIDTILYGVNDQNGELVELGNDGDSFYIK